MQRRVARVQPVKDALLVQSCLRYRRLRQARVGGQQSGNALRIVIDDGFQQILKPHAARLLVQWPCSSNCCNTTASLCT